MRVTADSGSSIPGYMKVTADSGCSIPIKMSTVPNSVPTRKFGLSRNRNRNYFSCFLSKNFNVFAHICLYCVYLVLNAFFTSKVPQILIQIGSNPNRKYIVEGLPPFPRHAYLLGGGNSPLKQNLNLRARQDYMF